MNDQQAEELIRQIKRLDGELRGIDRGIGCIGIILILLFLAVAALAAGFLKHL